MNAMVRAGDIANSLEEIQRVGRMLAMTGYFAAKGDTPQAIAQIATQILAGREMGYGPFASVQGIHIIQGKPTLSANLMASAVKNSPRYDYRVREISEKVCRIEFFEYVDGKRESLGISEFTLEQAQKAGVKNLDKYARNMLFARAMSNGVRWFCPDVFSGNAVYVPEELGAEVDGEGDVIEVTGVHIDDAPAIDENGPTATQSAQTSQHTTPDAKTPQKPATPATEDAGDDGTPAHQRFFGVGLSVFGPDWNAGARAWLIEKWSAKVTPKRIRTSSTQLSNDEKDLLADYMHEHAADLQRVWKNVKPNRVLKEAA
jgi:hypothetical protein